MIKLEWGTEKQIKFKNEKEYYFVLGMLSNHEIARIYIEDNAKRGSFSDAYRIHLSAEARKHKLPNSINNAMRNAGRINCNEYVLNLIDNHAFIISGALITATFDNVITSVPKKYTNDYLSGYKLLIDQLVSVPKSTYQTESIDVSKSVLVEGKFPNMKKKKASTKKISKTGKRDYIQKAIDNFELGEAGEGLVYRMQQEVLQQAFDSGKLKSLIGVLEWVSQKDDSAGYDIKTINVDTGEDLYIEVKTTTGTNSTPFYISENELRASKKLSDKYIIYRLYGFKKNNPDIVKYFLLRGDISNNPNVDINSQDSIVSFK